MAKVQKQVEFLLAFASATSVSPSSVSHHWRHLLPHTCVRVRVHEEEGSWGINSTSERRPSLYLFLPPPLIPLCPGYAELKRAKVQLKGKLTLQQ